MGFWTSKIDEPGRNTILALYDESETETPVGVCSFGKTRSADFHDWSEIYSIYILPGYTGQGFGEALLGFALAELKKTECAGIYLWVFKENYSARHFYEKYGFISTEEFSSCTLDETAVPEIKYVCKKQEEAGKNILNIILQKCTTPSVTLFISARFLTSCRN